jgi:putative ABC transport system permease protein
MFFITYLRRELRRRMRQAVFIALGLALGVGLVVTVAAASAGVNKAESGVLGALYGVGTDITVTGNAPPPHYSSSGSTQPAKATPPSKNGPTLQISPGGGAQICDNGHCVNAAGHTYDRLVPPYQEPISASTVAAVARLHDVAAAAGVLTLVDSAITYPANSAGSPQLATFTVDGVGTEHTPVGPLAAATISSGHFFTAADSHAGVALVDSGYAASNNLKTGSTISINQVRFTVIGIVTQPQDTSPPDVYIPLARAQTLATATKNLGGSVANTVNLIYVAAASAADIPVVQHEISRRLPGDIVTAAGSLASQVTGSLSSAARLTSDLGKWVSVLVLIAAFAVASLLTMAAVARRAAEFGTLKALGWPAREITAQVLTETATVGIAGTLAGVALGFAGTALVSALGPTLTINVTALPSFDPAPKAAPGALGHGGSVPVHFSAQISPGIIALAVALGILGTLLAGALGAWRAARLSPATALSRVG